MAATTRTEDEYVFEYCSTAVSLREAYRLRLEVFHHEQKFPEETEIDEFDPISAHFLLIDKNDGSAVATVRLTPYPRTRSSTGPPANGDTQPGAAGEKIHQNDTAMATSGGGPGGTSGGLAMTVSSSSNESASADQNPPRSDKEYHTGIAKEEEPAGLTTNTDVEMKLKRDRSSGFPLGGPSSESAISHEFLRKLKSKEPFKEVEGAPQARGAKLSRLAVSKSMRGKGLGAVTVRAAEAWLLRILSQGGGVHQGAMGQAGQDTTNDEEPGSIQSLTIIISSQMQAKAFYEKLSYVVYGEPYDEEGAPHTWCTKRLVYESDKVQS